MAEQRNPEQELLDWYANLKAKRVDLVGEYAGSELFLVEGDSLLQRCWNDSKLDFDRGFQLLHAVYAIERFLQGLVQRKCNFHLVFFDAHKHACIPPRTAPAKSSLYLLSRSVIIRHLKAHLPGSHPSISVRDFESVHDPQLDNYLKTSSAYFILCHDGASSAIDYRMRKTHKLATKILFRTMIHSFMKRGYNAALINELEWMDNKVMTMVLECSDKRPVLSELDLESSDSENSEAESSEAESSEAEGSEAKRSEIESTEAESSEAEDSESDSSQSTEPKIIENFLSKFGFNNGVPNFHDGERLEEQAKVAEAGLKGLAINDLSVYSERVYLALTTLAQLLQGNPSQSLLAVSFLIHAVLIGETRVSDRPQSWKTGTPSGMEIQTSKFIAQFCFLSRKIIDDRRWGHAMDTKSIKCDVADLIDGRLFTSIATGLTKKSFDEGEQFAWLKPKVKDLVQILHSLSGVRIDYQGQINISRNEVHNKLSKISVLPFSNSVFDKHLKSIVIPAESSKAISHESVGIFHAMSHSRNSKSRSDFHPQSEKDKLRAMRRNQFFMAEMQAYAASLTSAIGKSLEPENVSLSDGKKTNKSYVESSKDSDDSGSSRKSHNSKAAANRKGGSKATMLGKIAAEKASKDNENVDKFFSSWQTVRRNYDSEPEPRLRYMKAKKYLQDLPDPKRAVLQAEVEFFILTMLLEIYRDLHSKGNEKETTKGEELYGIAALIWDSIRKLLVANGLTKTIVNHLRQITTAMGLPATEFPDSASNRELSFTPNIFLSRLKQISLKSSDFQFLHCGPYMDRNLDSRADPRVPFKPDGWQRQVLDELDADRSVFVVAPTSAGKTFISFYAMERVLKANDDNILVYVAPTKALVNQIAAEIQARYKKNYKYPGKSVWAIHTRDSRINNPQGCQILVTVPHILQLMLLDPSNAKSWSTKVKTIIFDEIHSIGNADDGVIWEQLLLLAPCPIIALSATVGNPEQFSDWLATTQESSGFKLTMIKHDQRYSSLRKFAFVPPKRFAFHGLAAKTAFGTLGLDGLEGFSFIHPVASLVNRSRGMPEDLSLEARDCLFLWQAISRHKNARFPVDPSLDPEKIAFGKIVRKADIIMWEERLKSLLRSWMSDLESPFDKVVEDLGKSLNDQHHSEVQISYRHASDLEAHSALEVDENDLLETTLPLLCKLHERDALPAIFFCYDRLRCEEIGQAVLMQLIAGESKWKEKSSWWKKHISDWEQWKLEQEKMAGKKPLKKIVKKKNKDEDDDEGGPGSKAERMQDKAETEASPFATFDPSTPVDGFHFAARYRIVASELDGYLYPLKKRGIAKWLTDALLRGIGVHHAGMNRKYRQVVEMLFRKGYLRVVIATGTLALGINMPCATVVFSGDNVFLTALNFRQAAGRAGRRGFDLLGNVVFQNMTDSKIHRLISSRLPDLNGHFPITTSLVLRLFALLHESGKSPYAVKAIDSLLSQPRLYLDGSAFKDQVLHHLRFSIEYLRRQGLLSAQGAPASFADITSTLYFTENATFALTALLRDGFFHELCSDIKDKEDPTIRTLMIVMAHLFLRRPCRQVEQENTRTTVARSSSNVFLPSLPRKAARILQQHNKDTLEIFAAYVETFVDQHIKSDDNELPLTGATLGGEKSLGDFAGILAPPKVRSAFVALSGHGDTFDNISDLCQTTREGVFLEEAVIPHFPVYPDEARTPLNAYLYDFYMNGDIDTLESANNVRKSDVWFLLNDFSTILATITASLANFLKLPSSDPSMLDVMGGGDEQDNLEDDKFAAEMSGEKGDISLTSGTSGSSDRGRARPLATSAPKSRPKQRVAASWDDEEEADQVQGASPDSDEDWDDEGVTGQSAEEIEKGFMNVYVAFTKLRVEFDTKFKKIFA